MSMQKNCVEGFVVIKSDSKNLGKLLDQTWRQVFQVSVLSLSSRMLVTHVHAWAHAYTQEFFFCLMQNWVWQSGAVISCYGAIHVCSFFVWVPHFSGHLHAYIYIYIYAYVYVCTHITKALSLNKTQLPWRAIGGVEWNSSHCQQFFIV